MIFDKELQVSNAQAVTASAASDDYIDFGAAGDVGVSDTMHMCITVDEAADAVGAATVTFQLEKDDNTSFSTPVVVASSAAIGKAELVIGKQIFLPLPIGTNERYLRVKYTVATGPLTAGKFSAGIVASVQADKSYPSAS